MTYSCLKCDKIFKQKSHYEYHINRKFSCIKNYKMIDISNNNNNNITITPTQNHPNTTQNHPNTTQNHQKPTQIYQNISNDNKNITILTSNNDIILPKIICEYC